MTHVLDASALLALIQNEKGASKVENILNSETPPFIHAINFLEIEYKLNRKHSSVFTKKTIRWLKDAPITITEILTPQITEYARYLKSKYHLSLADSIGLGLAKFLECPFLTADHHELDPISKEEKVQIEFIR